MKAIRRPQFLLDVEATAEYLVTQAGENVALRWKSSLKQTLVLLCQFPELGRLRPDLPIEGIRTFNVKNFSNWLIFYRLSENEVEFLRVKHGMMHLPALFEPPSS